MVIRVVPSFRVSGSIYKTGISVIVVEIVGEYRVCTNL